MARIERALFILVVSFVLSALAVSAMSVTPARVNFVYDPNAGLNEKFTVSFGSTEAQPGLADVQILGHGDFELYRAVPDDVWRVFTYDEISKYISVDKQVLDLSKSGDVKVTVDIPPRAPLEGPHEFGVYVRERPKAGGMIGVTTAVMMKVRIEIPFPGQYVDITKFSITDVNEGESAKMTWQAKGRGDQVTPFTADLELFSQEGQSVFRRSLPTVPLAREESYPPDGTEESLPTNSFKAGTYTGVLTVKFTNMTKNSTTKFRVGYEAVALDNYTPKRLVAEEINGLHLTVRNLWNGQFDNVRAVIEMNGTSATTPSGKLAPFGTLELRQFFDIRGVPEGNYSANITVFFSNNSMLFPASFEVAKRYVPPPPAEKWKLFSGPGLYVTLGVLLLVIMGVLLFFFFRRRKGGQLGADRQKQEEGIKDSSRVLPLMAPSKGQKQGGKQEAKKIGKAGKK
jgi:hypothetical protein